MEKRQRALEGLVNQRVNILHIAAHLGGGAGKAISGIAVQGQQDFKDRHRILLLQAPEKSGYVQVCQENGVPVMVWSGDSAALDGADVIVVSWWNHPTMAQLLRNLPKISTPLVLWCHVNGCHYPFLPYSFAAAFDGVLFTSPYSFENPLWSKAERQEIRGISEIVWGMGQFAPEGMTPKSDYQNRTDFTIGYAGTLNYGKIHPQFVNYCREACARVPNVRFVMAGDRDTRLEQDIQAAGLGDRFTFPGFVSDIPSLMRSFDVFGYLLNPEHYGTTENVLLEAMACGLPCVVLRQNVEQFIVPSPEDCTVETAAQYGERLAFLRQHPEARERLGREARDHVLAHYNTAENTARFHAACAKAAEGPHQSHDFSMLGETPWQWFLYCLDRADRLRFARALEGPSDLAPALIQTCPPILREERKSSLRHFAAAYPEDEFLQFFSKLMEKFDARP